jgi:hypothetical protein
LSEVRWGRGSEPQARISHPRLLRRAHLRRVPRPPAAPSRAGRSSQPASTRRRPRPAARPADRWVPRRPARLGSVVIDHRTLQGALAQDELPASGPTKAFPTTDLTGESVLGEDAAGADGTRKPGTTSAQRGTEASSAALMPWTGRATSSTETPSGPYPPTAGLREGCCTLLLYGHQKGRFRRSQPASDLRWS